MEFDIIEISAEELSRFGDVQMQLLRNAQKKKNELKHKLEQDMEMFRSLVLTNNMRDSSLLTQKREELESEYNYQTAIIAEQLEFALQSNSPFPDKDDIENVGYIVDYSLSYTERYSLVRDYYLSIPDPAERMALYSADAVAKKYLGSYYSSLYNVLYTYSQ